MWIVRRLVYAWSLKKIERWEAKQLAAHVKQMVDAYDLLGEILETWIRFDGRENARVADGYVLLAACQWLHPTYLGTQSEPLSDLKNMIDAIITPPLPLMEVKDASDSVVVPAPVCGPDLNQNVGASTHAVVPVDAPDAAELMFRAQEVLFTTCATHFFHIVRL